MDRIMTSLLDGQSDVLMYPMKETFSLFKALVGNVLLNSRNIHISGSLFT